MKQKKKRRLKLEKEIAYWLKPATEKAKLWKRLGAELKRQK